jgi:hypothetical protein
MSDVNSRMLAAIYRKNKKLPWKIDEPIVTEYKDEF